MKSRIDIPTPCSEDWNKMTPTEKGAFCDKCAFEVIDFTHLSPEDIKMTLKQRMGQKTCGHISRTQMDIVNTNYHLWENQSPTTLRSKFLYACLMVFGMTLFTGCNSATENEHDVGDVEYHDDEIKVGMIDAEADSSYQCDDIIEGEMEIGDVEFIDEDENLKGMIENE